MSECAKEQVKEEVVREPDIERCSAHGAHIHTNEK